MLSCLLPSPNSPGFADEQAPSAPLAGSSSSAQADDPDPLLATVTSQPRAPVEHATLEQLQQILAELRDATGFASGCWESRAQRGWAELGAYSSLEELGQGVYGVSIDERGRLTALFLADVGLTGDLPASIGRLDDLERLYLSGNPLLGGALPPHIGSEHCLPNLRVLVAQGNESLRVAEAVGLVRAPVSSASERDDTAVLQKSGGGDKGSDKDRGRDGDRNRDTCNKGSGDDDNDCKNDNSNGRDDDALSIRHEQHEQHQQHKHRQQKYVALSSSFAALSERCDVAGCKDTPPPPWKWRLRVRVPARARMPRAGGELE